MCGVIPAVWALNRKRKPMLIHEKRKADAKRSAKADAKKRAAGLVPRKHWVHKSNPEEFKRVAELLKTPNVKIL